MKLLNPFQLNDWPFRKFIIIMALIQISLVGLIFFDYIGISIPLLRELIGFIYLTFIPGLIILRILRLHELGSVETILYCVGLSLTTLMFLGFLMNILFPIIGIKNPISFNYIISLISILILILCIFSYVIDKEFSSSKYLEINFSQFKIILLLCFIPLLTILGTYIMNNYDNNIILIIVLIIVSITLLLVSFNKIPIILYPFTIFIISLSILFHTSLISNYIWGWDINVEYYFSSMVLANNLWNYTIPGNVNSMLSIVMLDPIYSIILKTNSVWILKVIYPLLFSLVPLGLYRVFQRQTNDKIAFFSSFFFISLFTFYFEMPMLARQEIAELFLVLILLVIVDIKNDSSRTFLLIIFTMSLVVSHYGLSYIVLLLIIFVFIITKIINNVYLKDYKKDKIKKTRFYKTTSFTFFIFFIVFTLAWYLYISSSSSFITIVGIANNIINNLFSSFLDSNSVQGLSLIQSSSNSSLHFFAKMMQLAAQFFILIGIVSVLFNKIKVNITNEFKIYSVMSLFILLLGITIPFFSSSLNTSRLYQISLFFLAPFCIIGFITIFNLIKTFLHKKWKTNNAFHFFAIFLIVFFCFNNGLFYEVTNDGPTSLSLTNLVDFPYFNQEEVSGANWLHNYGNTSLTTYSDYYNMILLNGYIGYILQYPLNLYINHTSYYVLGTQNILNNSIFIEPQKGNSTFLSLNNTAFLITLNNSNRIYDNNGYVIYIKN